MQGLVDLTTALADGIAVVLPTACYLMACGCFLFFGWTLWSPPGEPGGGTTLSEPPSGGFCCMAESTAGGQMMPFDDASLSLSVPFA